MIGTTLRALEASDWPAVSQIFAAAVLTNHLAQGKVHVRSADSSPLAELNPALVAVMAEHGLDMSQEFPKPLTDDVVQAADVVITMVCGEACAIYPSKRYLDWDLTDPDGLGLDDVHAIRDQIRHHVIELMASLPST